MKSIVVFLLLLLAVATSGQMINGWGNLTYVHDDDWKAEAIWDSLAATNPKTLGYGSLHRQPVCRATRYNKCLGVANKKPKACFDYNRCKRAV